MSSPTSLARFATRACALSVAALAVCSAAHAVTTRQFALDAATAFSEGKLEGAAVLSSGAVVASVGVQRVELANAGVARCVLPRADGSAIVGTGNQGKLFRVSGTSSAPWGETGELMVSALAADEAGTVYAGTLPHGKIFAFDAQGKGRLFAQPPGAEHIWALVRDARKHVLYAATGPQGKVFVIDEKPAGDTKRKIEPYLTTNARHVMSLALDPSGTLYAGTSDEALLWRVEPGHRPEVVYDFEGNELTALSVRDGKVAVTANNFPKPPNSGDKPAGDSKDAPKPGTSDLWVVEPNGEARKLFSSSDDGHLSAVQWAKDGSVYAATGKAGHIYRVRADGTYALWIDVEERQVLDLHLNDEQPSFSTGDAGAYYRVQTGAASTSQWTSKVLDAGFPARFGRLDWRGQGKLTFQTRTGNTEKPGDGWSEWSSALAQPGPIRSPGARFLQLRLKLDAAPESVLYAVQAYYLPGNQMATSKEISIKPAPPKGSEDSATPIYRIEWKVDNPDGDRLRYRLRFRAEGSTTWRPLLRESEVLTKTQYDWVTDGVPDGYYRIEVESSDELDNPDAAVRVQRTQSEPFLVDNRPPQLANASWAQGKLTGTVSDAQGPITRLEYSVNAQDWHPLAPLDGLLDSREERFELSVGELAKTHPLISVRARDARNNVATSELPVK